jgi:hypothetical protein
MIRGVKVVIDCLYCNGSGQVEDRSAPFESTNWLRSCSMCKGDGLAESNETITDFIKLIDQKLNEKSEKVTETTTEK